MKRHRVQCVSLVFIFLFAFFAAVSAQKTVTSGTPPVTIRGDISVTTYGGDTPRDMTPEQKLRWDSFVKVWETVDNNYFDQTFNGLDWNKVRSEYRTKVIAVKTDAEFHRTMQEMINLLNRSHFAIVPPEVYREIERARALAKEREKVRREGRIAEGEDPDSIPEEGSLIDESKFKFGTGIELRLIKGQFVISRVDTNSAAEYAGVRAGYVLDQINGVSLSDMVGRTLIYYSYIRNIERYIPQQIVEWFLNGEKDSYVTISCLDADDKPVEFKIRREKLLGQRISIGANYPEQFLKFESRSLSEDVGYLRFNLFALPIIERYCAAISEFKDKKAIVIDLRGNSGGIIGTIYALSGMLTDGSLDMGTSIYKVGSEKLIARSKIKNFKGRIVFLVDNQTISAAEIFSAGIQENNRALVVGETTAGEALPSISMQLPTGAVFSYPIANFKTKKGNFLEGSGVKPDYVVALDRKALLNGTDSQLEKALSLIAENKAFPTPSERLDPPPVAISGPRPPQIAVPAPTPKPVPKTIQGDSNIGIGDGTRGDSDGKSVKTIQGIPAKSDVFVKMAPPSIFTKEIVAPKDAKSLQVIAQFINKIGGETQWKDLKTYAAAGRTSAEIRGAKGDWDFRAYRQEPDSYSYVLSSPVVGEIRQIYTPKKTIMQTDFGTEESFDLGGSGSRVDIFAPIRALMEADAIVKLSYQGIFDRDGRKCHVIEAKLKSGETVGLAFDVESGLLVSYAQRPYTIVFGDYRKVSNLLLPFHVDMGRAGALQINSLIINQPIDPATFLRKDNCFDKPLQ